MCRIKGLLAVLAVGMIISGCVGIRDSIPIMGESEDGTKVVIAQATRTRLYALSKAAEKIELWSVSSDKGVTMKGSDSSSDGTALVPVLEKGMEIGAAFATARHVSAAGASSAAGAVVAPAYAGAAGESAAAVDAGSETDYNTEGYGGSPGADGSGVYGKPSCGRCRSYRAAHPDVAIINIDDAANQAAMWSALRARKYNGTSIDLPVSVTATSFTAAAR